MPLKMKTIFQDSIPLLQKYIDGGKIIVACDMYSIKQIHDYHINQLKILLHNLKGLLPSEYCI